MIDYNKNIVFAQKSFVNNKPEENISLKRNPGELILDMPESVFEYIDDFPKEKLDFQQTITDVSMLPNIDSGNAFGSAALKFGRLRFSLNLDANARIKGKITTVQVDEEDFDSPYEIGGTMVDVDLEGKLRQPSPSATVLTKEGLGFANEQIALKSAEIDTLIQVVCKTGTFLKKVNGVAVSSRVCRVSIIDYKGLATVAEKTFENKEIQNDRYSDPSIYEDKKDDLDFPRAEIETYIKSFPK